MLTVEVGDILVGGQIRGEHLRIRTRAPEAEACVHLNPLVHCHRPPVLRPRAHDLNSPPGGNRLELHRYSSPLRPERPVHFTDPTSCVRARIPTPHRRLPQERGCGASVGARLEVVLVEGFAALFHLELAQEVPRALG